jgi:hypothetical protein
MHQADSERARRRQRPVKELGVRCPELDGNPLFGDRAQGELVSRPAKLPPPMTTSSSPCMFTRA